MSTENFDLVVIGSGPGGYVGAIRAAQLGLKTCVVEKDKTLGGTCLNVGCIPSKALLESSELYHAATHDLDAHGVKLGSVSLDLPKMMARKSKIVGDLTGGIEYLFKKNKITWLKGTGRLVGPHQVQISPSTATRSEPPITVEAKNIMIATGSVPRSLPTLPADGENIITSTEALSLDQVPKRLAVVGAGAIGLEMGSVWARLGAHVTVIEFGGRIGGLMDGGLAGRYQQILARQGLTFLLNSQVTAAKVKKGSVELTYTHSKTGPGTVVVDKVLVAAGRVPFTEGLGLSELGIKTDDRGFIQVDDHLRTHHSHIYAVGDVIPGPMLAHKAEEEGVAAAEIMSGRPGHVNYETVPSVIYTWPEVASVGKTEEQLKAEGVKYAVGTFPFSANGRAKALGTTDGQVKILADAATDRLLGVHILGPRASDLIAEAVVAMEFGGSAEDLARSFHAHPTLSEVVREAALAVDGRARQS